jgi:hypothetical protein
MDRPALNARLALGDLASDAFDQKIAPMSSAAYTRTLIRQTSEFAEAKRALDAGLITESMIRSFVAKLMREFTPGCRFRYETTFAALAVLCEAHFARFAEELLFDLAALKAPEINHAIRVARECLQNRVHLPKTKAKVFSVAPRAIRSVTQMRQATAMWKCLKPTNPFTYAVA